MKQKHIIKLFSLVLLSIGMFFAIVLIIRYTQPRNTITIHRMPHNNSRLANISIHDGSSLNTRYLSNAMLAKQQLFTLPLEQRRIFVANYLNLQSTSSLQQVIVGDYIIAMRLASIAQEMQLNGVSTNETAINQIAFASSMNQEQVKRLLDIAVHSQSIESFLKIYPTIASPEWEIFIQSQELSQLLHQFAS